MSVERHVVLDERLEIVSEMLHVLDSVSNRSGVVIEGSSSAAGTKFPTRISIVPARAPLQVAKVLNRPNPVHPILMWGIKLYPWILQ